MTEACFGLLHMHYVARGYDFRAAGDWLTHISDRCACQYMCADHFGSLQTWTNPGHAVSNRRQGATTHDVSRSTVEAKAVAAKRLQRELAVLDADAVPMDTVQP